MAGLAALRRIAINLLRLIRRQRRQPDMTMLEILLVGLVRRQNWA
jgi:hypothetical protein